MSSNPRLAERHEEYWVVDVEDPADLEKDIPGYRKRFTFSGEDAAQRAWQCWSDAQKAGFLSKAERAKRV